MADVVLLAESRSRALLLIQRGSEPFAGQWALPGGFVEERERAVDAARRELREETGLEVDDLGLVGVFDIPGRDPRGWTVSAAFWGVVAEPAQPTGGDDAADARWFAIDALPELAFDHAEIVRDALALADAAR